jgi:hypothetical protein
MRSVQFLSLAIVFGVLVIGCSGTQEDGDQTTQQEIRVAAQDSLIADQATLVESLLARLEEQESLIAELDVRSQELAAIVVAVKPSTDVVVDLSGLQSDIDLAMSLAEDAYDRADEVASCVNNYMDVIGRWSSNVNSYYEWNYC